MHRNWQVGRQTNRHVTSRRVQRGVGKGPMIAGELNRDWASPGFHLRALTKVV